MDLSHIGENIKNRRKELGLTQTRIKELTGISSGNMSGIENGTSLPSCQALLLLSDALECSVDWLLREHSLLLENSESFSKLSNIESDLLDSFRFLSIKEKEDVLEYVQFKEFKSSRNEKRESNDIGKSFHSDHDSNSSNDYGIA